MLTEITWYQLLNTSLQMMMTQTEPLPSVYWTPVPSECLESMHQSPLPAVHNHITMMMMIKLLLLLLLLILTAVYSSPIFSTSSLKLYWQITHKQQFQHLLSGTLITCLYYICVHFISLYNWAMQSCCNCLRYNHLSCTVLCILHIHCDW